MSIDYSATVGVGCSYDDLKYEVLTDEAKGMFKGYAEQQTTYYEEDDKVVDKLQSFMLQSSDIPKTKKGRKELLSKLMYEQYEQEKQGGK